MYIAQVISLKIQNSKMLEKCTGYYRMKHDRGRAATERGDIVP